MKRWFVRPRWSALSIVGAIVYGYGVGTHSAPYVLGGMLVAIMGTPR